MRRTRAAAMVMLAALVLSACSGGDGGSGQTEEAAAEGEPVSLTMWVGFSDRELGVIEDVVEEFDEGRDDLEIEVVGGVNDDRIVAAMRGGDAPDVASTFSSFNVGTFCRSGGFTDLGPYMERDGIDADSILTESTQYYTQFEGTRCALPMLNDAYGFYYNNELFAEAGLSEPPTTLSELAEYARTLTKRGPDGSLEVLGFNPLFGFYQNTPGSWAVMAGAEWVDEEGTSVLSSDPAWAELLQWQKDLVDEFSYDELVEFQAGAGDEFSASNAFQTGKLAMAIDGEWRVAFIDAEAPDLDYGTAPMPVADDDPERYGAGYINGTIIGIPHNAEHPEQAWELVKYLTTDDHALAQLSNGLRNVPSTKSALESDELTEDEHFEVFLDIAANSESSTTPITAVGAAYMDLVNTFVAEWQAGGVPDLQAGLADLDQQIDSQLAQAGGP